MAHKDKKKDKEKDAKKGKAKKPGKGKEKKPSKSGKPNGSGKPGRSSSSSKLKEADIKTALARRCCTCCGKRCPLSKPKCGKGRSIARKLEEKLA